MAKADLRKPETDTWRADIGQTLQRAISLLGWSLKEFAAAAVHRDERQCARWITVVERPQLDAIFSVPELRRVFVVALAEVAGDGVEIHTVITVRRSA